MAGLRKLKGKYYARLSIPQDGNRWKDHLIPLKTSEKKVAAVRRLEVEKHEAEIKAGITFVFPWESETGTTAVKHYTLAEAMPDYLRARRADGLREKTLDMYRLALTHFQEVVGENQPVDTLTTAHIQAFKEVSQTQFDHSPTTININLRAIKTFLRWLRDQDHLSDVPAISLVRTGKSLPIYLSNPEFQQILQQVPPHYQRAFWFYRATGCRLREPFEGTLNGQFLTIHADTAKTHQERDVYLTPDLLAVVQEMRSRFAQREVQAKTFIDRYSKRFKRACRACNVADKKFHSLRHTFAVRTYLRTRDIYKVAKLLGHASVTTTEIYAKFNLKRLQQDFPDLVSAQATEYYGADQTSPATDRVPAGVRPTQSAATAHQSIAAAMAGQA